jgi:N-acetylmuramoyl-L-alanine amidase
MRKINKIIIHCSATREGQDNINAKTIDRWHKARGWNGIGYHYVILQNGTIEFGRPIEQVGAHCKGQNTGSIGICYIGGVESDGKTPKDTRTEAQKESMTVLFQLFERVNPDIMVYCHNQFSSKACPSFKIEDL